MKNSRRFSRRFCVLVAGAFALTTGPAFASNTWNGGGASNNWSDNNNWGGAQPGYGTLTFSGTTRTTNSDDNITSMNQLIWTGANAWTLNQGGSTVLSLFDNNNGATQAKVENDSTGLVTINLPVTFAQTNGNGASRWGEINAVNGGITFGTGTLTVAGSNTILLGIRLFGSGQIINFNNTVNASNATNGGNGDKYFGFTTSGTGNTVNIGGTFNSGDWYVMNNGTLNLASGGSLTTTAIRLGGDFGNTGSQDQTKGGTFQLTNLTGGQTFGSTINSISGNTSGTLLVNALNTSGTDTISGGIFLDSQLRIGEAGGTLVLSGGIDTKAQLLLFQGSGNINVTSVIQNSTGTPASSVQIGGNGVVGGPTVTYSTANTYTGDTLVRAGTLAFATGGSIANSTIRLGSSSGTSVTASVNLTNATGGQTLASVINPVTTSGSGTLTLNSQNTSGTNTLSNHIGMDRDFTIQQNEGGTLNITQARSGVTTTTGTDIKGFTLTFKGTNATTGNPTAAINYSGDIYNSVNSGSVQIGGTSNANANGVIVTLSGNNTYSGSTTLRTNSQLNIGSATALGTSSLNIAGNGSFDNTTGNGALSLSNVISLGASPTFIGTSSLTLSGATTIASNNRTITVSANTLTLSGAIGQDASLRGLTKAGNGTLAMSGSSANTYTGLTTVSAGELDLNKTAGVNAIAGDGVAGTNDVNVTGGTLKWQANEQVQDTATITVAGGTVDLNGKTETLGSLIVNSGIFQTGAGHLIGTTASMTFAGGSSTVNSGGIVEDGHIIVTGGTNTVQGGASEGLLHLLSGGLGLQMTGANITLNSDATTPGRLLLDGNVSTSASSTTASITSGGAATNAGVVDMNGGTRTFTVATGTTSSGIDLSIGAKVTSPGGAITKLGTGTMELTGANTYGGGTTVSAGTLLANNTTGSATGSAGVAVNSGGTLGGTGFIVATGNNININGNGNITGATNGTVGALTLTASNVIFGGTAGNLGTYVVDLNASTSDRLAITGNLDLSSAFDQISFQGTTGAASYQLITYSGLLSGTFDTVSSLPSGYTLSYLPGEIDLVTAVPETSTWVMGALALSTLLWSQRNRLQRKRQAAR